MEPSGLCRRDPFGWFLRDNGQPSRVFFRRPIIRHNTIQTNSLRAQYCAWRLPSQWRLLGDRSGVTALNRALVVRDWHGDCTLVAWMYCERTISEMPPSGSIRLPGRLVTMPLYYFALRIESHSLVAAEVSDQTAASLLDRGEPLLLGTFSELGALSHRLGLPLITISRTVSPAPCRGRLGLAGARVAAVA